MNEKIDHRYSLDPGKNFRFLPPVEMTRISLVFHITVCHSERNEVK